MYVCRDHGRAEDAVQEAFISLWHSRASYRPDRGPVAAWLLTLVRHRAIDLARRNDKHAARRASEDRLDAHPATDDPDDVAATVARRADAGHLQALLSQLPAPQREVIQLAIYSQLTHSEIAEHLDVPAGTVKGRMRLGLEKLRDRVAQDAFG